MFSGTKGYRTKPPVGVRLNPLHPLSRGLVGCWLFNEGAGSVAHDISGYGNHGTLTNMSPNAQNSGWGGGKFGRVLQFDGADDHVDCGNSSSLDLSIFTIAFNIKVKQIDGGWNIICGKEIYNNTEGYYFPVDANWLRFTIGSAGDVYTSTKLGEFVHITGTFDGSTAKLYENGSFVMQDTSVSFTPADISLLIGARHQNDGTGYTDTSNIVMDECRMYNRAISAAEVKTLYENPFCNLLRVPVRYVPAVPGGLPIPVAMNYYRRRRVA